MLEHIHVTHVYHTCVCNTHIHRKRERRERERKRWRERDLNQVKGFRKYHSQMCPLGISGLGHAGPRKC